MWLGSIPLTLTLAFSSVITSPGFACTNSTYLYKCPCHCNLVTSNCQLVKLLNDMQPIARKCRSEQGCKQKPNNNGSILERVPYSLKITFSTFNSFFSAEALKFYKVFDSTNIVWKYNVCFLGLKISYEGNLSAILQNFKNVNFTVHSLHSDPSLLMHTLTLQCEPIALSHLLWTSLPLVVLDRGQQGLL